MQEEDIASYKPCSPNDSYHSAHIPLPRTSHMATVTARNSGKCSLAYGKEEEEIKFDQ